MHTFFVKYAKNFDIGDNVKIEDKDDCFHIARSLRMAVGEMIGLSDGDERYTARLVSIHDGECLCEICERLGRGGEPPYRVDVFQALVKGDKLETVIQKSVELGAERIIPFVSEFCTVKPKDEKSEWRKSERRSAIAKEAAKQCGRTVLPDTADTVSFAQMLTMLGEYDVAIFCCEFEKERTLGEFIRETNMREKRISVIVGSEGGFSREESDKIKAAGAVSVSLGERILRAESASLYVLSALSAAYEL